MIKKISVWINDYIHLINGAIDMYIHSKPPAHYTAYTLAKKVPIIILPGIAMRWGFMKPLGDYLSLKGHPVYVIPELKNNLYSIKQSAEKVLRFIKVQKLQNVIIIGYSKGGLISKYVLIKNNNKIKINVIGIAVPFSGSSAAKIFPHSSYQELKEGGQFLEFLAKHESVNKGIISIIPEYDNHVWSKNGSYLTGALKNIHVPIHGHHKVIRDKKIFEAVYKSIKQFDR